jgi:HK97 family phage prohead protease
MQTGEGLKPFPFFSLKRNKMKDYLNDRGAMHMKNLMIEVKDIKQDQGLISGWANKYDVYDRHGDILVKGAMPEAATIPVFLNHDPSKTVGKGMAYEKDGKGIWIDLKLFIDSNSQTIKERALEAFELAREGVMKFSVGFITKDAAWDKVKINGKDTPARVIKGIELIEVSLVQIPANNESNVLAVKSGENHAADILDAMADQKEEEMLVIHIEGPDAEKFAEEILDESTAEGTYIYEEDPGTIDKFISHLTEYVHDYDVNVTVERSEEE